MVISQTSRKIRPHQTGHEYQWGKTRPAERKGHFEKEWCLKLIHGALSAPLEGAGFHAPFHETDATLFSRNTMAFNLQEIRKPASVAMSERLSRL